MKHSFFLTSELGSHTTEERDRSDIISEITRTPLWNWDVKPEKPSHALVGNVDTTGKSGHLLLRASPRKRKIKLQSPITKQCPHEQAKDYSLTRAPLFSCWMETGPQCRETWVTRGKWFHSLSLARELQTLKLPGDNLWASAVCLAHFPELSIMYFSHSSIIYILPLSPVKIHILRETRAYLTQKSTENISLATC